MYSVILCGGSGTRLWPLSRKNYPKQFLRLYSDKSLLQETYLRMRELMPAKKIFFVLSENNFFNVYNQIKEIDGSFKKRQVLIEPAKINTAPAIAFAMKHLNDIAGAGEDEPIAILPADHHIENKKEFLKIIKKAIKNVGDNIGTIGITPTKPETGYGYIKKGDAIKDSHRVDEFKEKPDKKTAQKYLDSGKYVWNSGMYIFNYKTFKNETEKYVPKMFKAIDEEMSVFLKSFKNLPAESIDYAISEKSDKVIVFEGDFGWSDIGSFDGLADVLLKKDDKNPKHIKINSENVFIHSETDKLIATMDVNNLIVVENNDSILIQKRGESENVREVVKFLKDKNLKEINHNVIIHRPWGKYEVLIDGTRHKVSKLTVYPGERLSLQMHERKVEHWVVIKGEAEVINGKDKKIIKADESVFIPKSTKHQLCNPGKTNLEIIEVQTGDYLGGDDVKNFNG